jgi:hypothetical protein
MACIMFHPVVNLAVYNVAVLVGFGCPLPYSMHDSRSYLFVEQPLSLADRASRNFVAVTLVMKSHHFWLEIQSKTMQVLQSNAQ